jgi:glycolate oxidase
MGRVAEIAAEMDVLIANVFHAGDGNLHPCILFDERKPGELEKVLEAGGRILATCVEAGGALSGEHGIGVEKQAYMPLVFTDADMRSMARLAPAFGAGDGAFNPDKVFPIESADDTRAADAARYASVGRTGTSDVV